MTDRPVLLIADDDIDVVRLLKLFLRPLDCEVLTAADGEEALAIAQSRLYIRTANNLYAIGQ